MTLRGEAWAGRIALAVPALALAGAYAFQYFGHLVPCEMCWWQRYAHFVALGAAVMGLMAPPRRLWAGLAGLAIAAAGLLGGYHAGVEYGWWKGFTACTSELRFTAGQSALDAIMAAPMVRCDQVQWSLFGISMAGYNCLFSLAGAAAVFWLLATAKRGAA